MRLYLEERFPEWRIDEAEAGEQAMAMTEEQCYELFLVDINMPGMSGMELGPLLVERCPQAKLIFLTANIQDATRLRIEAIGAGYLPKPVRPETVDQLLEVMASLDEPAARADIPQEAIFDLTTVEHDALLEVFNIAIGSAADDLSQMVDDEVLLSVPSLELIPLSKWLQREGKRAHQKVSAVRLDVSGPFHTEAILLFDEEAALRVVRSMVNDEMGQAMSDLELTDAHQEVMAEIGNVVLNACLGSIANMFESEFHLSTPEVTGSTYAQLLDSTPDEQKVLLLLIIDFGLRRQKVMGHIALVMDLPEMRELRTHVSALLSRY
jgi:chemotaxis protein CheC